MQLSTAEIEQAARMFAAQSKYCADAKVPTYAAILDGCIGDVRNGGPVCDLLQYWDRAPQSVFALRLLGALHRLALDGKAPALAALFPTAGGIQNPDLVWPVAREVLIGHRDYVIGYTARPPQTNEVARSAVLWPGFLTIAAQFPYPLRLREIGASAGLNLMWDQYRITSNLFTWGKPDAALELTTRWEGPVPDVAPFTVADRAACDRDPIDIRNTDDRARLESYIWADQVHRLQRLRKACDVAAKIPFRLGQADAGTWLENELRHLPQGQTTVVYYSIFRQYVSPETEAKLQAVMEDAAARATPTSPLAWLAMEMADMKSFPTLTLTTWPTGQKKILATAHHHGDWIKWHASA